MPRWPPNATRHPCGTNGDVYPVVNLTYLPSQSHILQLSLQQRQGISGVLGGAECRVLLGRRLFRDTGQPPAEACQGLSIALNYVLKVEVHLCRVVRPQQRTSLCRPFTSRPNGCWRYTASLTSTIASRRACRPLSPSRLASGSTRALTLIGMWMRDKDSDFYDLPFDRRSLAGIAVLTPPLRYPLSPT